jgi:hypothetical protein
VAQEEEITIEILLEKRDAMGENLCHGFEKDRDEKRELRKIREKGIPGLEEIARERAKERLEKIEAIKKEIDPWKIVQMAKIHRVVPSMHGGCYDAPKVEGYEEKIAAMENPHTPTLFILFLYHYPNKSKENFLGMNDLIGPRRDVDAPYVSDAVRKAAEEALRVRAWLLNDWDKNNLSPEMLDWCSKRLTEDWNNFRLRESLKDKTEINAMSLELVKFFDGKK